MKPTQRSLVAVLGAALLATSFATAAAAVDPVASTTTLSVAGGSATQDNHPLTLVAAVTPSDVDFVTDATIEFVDTDAAADVPGCAAVPVDAGNATSCTIPDPAAGTHHYMASYSGNTVVATSDSEIVAVVIAADTVDATGVGVNYGTFYPVVDNYRDTLRISGNRQEPIAVTIRIYNSNGKRVALVSKSRAAGGYAYEWNGKSSGTLLPAGKYRIVQTLVDAAGTTKAYTNYSNLSHKKLVTVTKTITKNGAAVAAAGGNVTKVGTAAKLKAGSRDAIAGWQLKIPSAVSYKSLKFTANIAAHLSAPPAIIAMQNFNICGSWNTGCFDRAKDIGNTSGSAKWYTTSGSPSAHRDGLKVRGLAGTAVGTIYVYKVGVKVTYTVLK